MAEVKIEDNTIEVLGAIDAQINIALEECAGALESRVTRNQTRVDSGHTKGKWQHYVDEEKHIAYVGNPLENAIWEEFGTGEQALYGNGRKGWTGKSPLRPLYRAIISTKPRIIKRLQSALKGL